MIGSRVIVVLPVEKELSTIQEVVCKKLLVLEEAQDLNLVNTNIVQVKY